MKPARPSLRFAGVLFLGACAGTSPPSTGDGGATSRAPCQGARTSAGCLVTLASGVDPFSVLADHANVYFTQSAYLPSHIIDQYLPPGAIVQLPLDGGSATTLASGIYGPDGLAVDSANVYFSGTGSDAGLGEANIFSVPVGGGAVATLAATDGTFVALAVDDTHVYWVDSAAKSVPKGGGAVVTLALGSASLDDAGDAPFAIARQDETLYWADDIDNVILAASCTGDGGRPIVSAAFSGVPHGIASDPESVYWTVQGASVTDGGTASSGAVVKAARGGGAAFTLASELTSPMGMAVDDAGVYWVDWTDGTVMQVGKSGGPSVTLATGQDNPANIAVLGSNLYWTNFGDGTVVCLTRD